jgi:cytochrome c oxidase assembly protein subunit 15
MTSFLKDDRSRAVAYWLFAVAALVLAMVVVGGATRLTDSGLSITEWKPISGAIPPMSEAAWAREFALYQRIPQFSQMNPDMTVESFKGIYWWEWSHRLLGRIVGIAFALPFAWFLLRRQVPRRLIWRCFGLLALGGLQGAVGWWMVSSGLSDRVSVAPERLMIHLSLALLLFMGLLWCGFEAWAGQGRLDARGPWARGGLGLTVLIFIQSMLGALVAANDAGKVNNDWPLMNGRFFPSGYAGDGVWQTFAHSVDAVQFNHRLFGYLVFFLLVAFAVTARRSRHVQPEVRRGAYLLSGLGVAQVLLGITTVLMVAPLALSIAHQILATVLLGASVWLTWRARRL